MEDAEKELFGRVRSLEDFRAMCKGLDYIGALVGGVIAVVESIL